MPPQIATLVFVLGVIALFKLDRDRGGQTSKALWIPVAWLWIAGSRAVSEWLAAMGWGPQLNVNDTYTDGSPADRNVLTALLLLGLIVLIRRKRFAELLRINIPIILFFSYAALSILWSDFPDITIKRWFKDVGDVVMAMIVLTDTDWCSAFRRVLVRTGFLLVPHSVLLIKYYPSLGRAYNRWTWVASFTGVTTHKNLLGRLCLTFGIVFVWCFLKAYRDRKNPHRTRHLIAQGIAIAMVAWLFAMANSVTAQTCCLLAVVFFIISGNPRLAQKRSVVHSLVAIMILAPFVSIFLGLGGDAIETLGRDSTLTGRTEIWALVLKQSGNPLVGTGFESFWLGQRLQTIQSAHVGLNESHNGFLEIFLNLGWIGELLLAVVILSGYRNVIRSFRQNPDAGRLRMAYFFTGVVFSFSEVGFRMLGLQWITFLMAAIAVPEYKTEISRFGAAVIKESSHREQVAPAALAYGTYVPYHS